MYRLGRLIARAARAASRRLGRTGGTTLPGRLLLRLSPAALGRMATELDEGAVLVSATNGKTTTSAMLAGALERSGHTLVHNRAGSNMSWGVATALLDAHRGTGQLGLLEVDEAWLPKVAETVEPRMLLLLNLFRDQLDRYGELELIADRWAELTHTESDRGTRLVLCADDPLVADLGRGRENVTYFGVSDDSQALPGLGHAADSKHCRNCGAAYLYSTVLLGHLGHYSCPNCGRERPMPAVDAVGVRLDGMSGSQVELRTPVGETSVRLQLPGLYNVYNAVGAAAAAVELGVPLEEVAESLEAFGGAFGRVETIPVDGRDVSILLVKNPTGANEVLRTLILEEGSLDLWLALNDRIADGRDVSWIWDADFELLAGRVRRATCSGTRAEEMALRLKYAGVDAELAVERDLERSLDEAVAAGDGRPLYALPTYTALIELRDLLARRGLASPVVGVSGGPAAWHDVECASYRADLPVWRALAREHGTPVLDLGCGTGRVALDLAGQGFPVTAVDSDPDLVHELSSRARERALPVDAITADVRSLELERRFPLAVAPMQVAQLLGGRAGRARMLERVRSRLEPGGVLAVALADPFDGVPAGEAAPPLPDVRERADGWVLSSLPVAVRAEPGAVAVDRLRQAVSPAGELSEQLVTIRLDSVSADELEAEARDAGLEPAGRRTVPPTRDHVGSTVVCLR